ncbi:hypothetical protein CC80DRAFT_595600 [Byssothecium circinans]|uniref:Rhodopsin domain-containing protein n=1 Tax=Byssothecium circinans TaxID=147558 RepID=A0A6A5TP15_9PLEO|nr:hypothetical protein CC80DRAFT_595600 [Byssothecium circinans]
MESPLRLPPPGLESDFTNPVSLGRPAVVSAGVCIPLILLFALVRVYARVLLDKWTFHDYLYCLSCLLGISYLSFAIPLALSKPFGHHVWDINTDTLTKKHMSFLQAFAIFTGPVLWLSKVTIFGFLIRIFKPTRWFKNSAYVGIIATGVVFSLYTCAVSLACAPKPDYDVGSYINGFRREACSSSNGANTVVSLITGIFDSLTNVYLLTAALILQSSLNVTVKEARSIYLLLFSGTLTCASGFMGVVCRFKSWKNADITGYQTVLTVAIIIEVTLSLLIPAMPSFYDIWKFYTHIEIVEQATIGAPSSRLVPSTLSFYPSGTSTPTISGEYRKTWRKTHMSIEELPYRKPSSEFYRSSPLGPRDSRMKALPATPFPAPKTPNSVKSMRLPILLESRYR